MNIETNSVTIAGRLRAMLGGRTARRNAECSRLPASPRVERLESRRLMSVATWDGGGADNLISTPGNWAGDVAPVNGDDLVFPLGTARQTAMLDAPRAFNSLTINDPAFVIDGTAALSLGAGGITLAVTGFTVGIHTKVFTPLVLTAPQTFTVNRVLSIRSTINLGSHLLTTAGSGGLVDFWEPISGSGGIRAAQTGFSTTLFNSTDATYTGDTVIDGSWRTHLSFSTLTSRLVLNSGVLEADVSTFAGLTQTGGQFGPSAGSAIHNVMTSTGNVSLTGGITGFEITTPNTKQDRLNVTGTVTLGNQLSIVPGAALVAGQAFTVIGNDGTDPVIGTFTFDFGQGPVPLADGATFDVSGKTYFIDYDGGDGNDVVITAMPPGSLGFSTSAVAVNEAAGSATLTVLRTGGSEGAVTADYTFVSGTATAGADVTGTGGTVSFADGETSKTITIPVVDDAVEEGAPESFQVTLGNFTGGATAGATTTASVTIQDDDGTSVLAFSDAVYVAGEAAGTANVTVNRVGDTTDPVTADYRVGLPVGGGSATAGADYTFAQGTLSFGVGETSKTFAVAILDDASIEGTESVLLALTSTTGPATVALPGGDAVLTIVDNEVNSVPAATDDVVGAASGQPVTIDVGVNDTDSDGHPLTISITSAPANGAAVATGDFITYTASAGFVGVDSFTYTASDPFGGADTATVTVVTGTSHAMTDPSDTTRTIVVIGGTAAADKISFTPRKGPGGGVFVVLNRQSQGPFSPGARIVIGTGAGNDRVTLTKASMPVQLDAGDGNDTVTGSALGDVLVGGAGDDRISGGSGRDVLIGGVGADRLVGGADDDVLVGGIADYGSTHAADHAALQDLHLAWLAGADYAARATQLAVGSGSSGARLAADTVDRDAARDMLTGDAGLELFFAVIDPVAQPDLVKGRKSGETVVEV